MGSPFAQPVIPSLTSWKTSYIQRCPGSVLTTEKGDILTYAQRQNNER